MSFWDSNIYLKGSTYSQFCIFTDFLTNLCLNIFLLLSLSKQSDSRLKTKPYYFFRGNYLRSGCNRSDLSYQYQRRKWRRCRWFWGQKSILWLSWMPKNVQKYRRSWETYQNQSWQWCNRKCCQVSVTSVVEFERTVVTCFKNKEKINFIEQLLINSEMW